MKAEVRICFYNSYKLQKWRKWVISFMQNTPHTHAHIELRFSNSKTILLTLDGDKPRVIWLGLNKKFVGVDPYGEFSLGFFDIPTKIYNFIDSYPKTNRWDLVLYQILSYVNLQNKNKIPPTCTTFIADFVNYLSPSHLPRFFSPKQLWRFLHDGYNDWRQS